LLRDRDEAIFGFPVLPPGEVIGDVKDERLAVVKKSALGRDNPVAGNGSIGVAVNPQRENGT
jgi:hypothetical protein